MTYKGYSVLLIVRYFTERETREGGFQNHVDDVFPFFFFFGHSRETSAYNCYNESKGRVKLSTAVDGHCLCLQIAVLLALSLLKRYAVSGTKTKGRMGETG